MAAFAVHIWKKVPFLRLLLPLVAGIAAQWHFQLWVQSWWITLMISAVVIAGFFFIPFFRRFRLNFLNGMAVCTLFFSLGALLTWYKDIRHNDRWMGNFYTEKSAVIVTLEEPPVEKSRSIKANATVSYLADGKTSIPVKGRIILYFQKDSSAPRVTKDSLGDSLRKGKADSTLPQLNYGSQIIFIKPLQEIKNSGNPGGFDFQRYSLFHGITHQVYLKPGEFTILREKKEKWLDKFLYQTREKVLAILRNNINGREELGLAEALLIGYKDDLDQALVRSYTNTGVVHIIAISGLHLGLIYWLLVQFFKPLRRRRKISWLRPVLIITGLWLFSLLAGAQASVLRSAVMFTCIVIGESLSKKNSIYNTMALSAFLVLCYNPYLLWDVGFQLSYAAVLSILIFLRPVYNWFYFQNKLLDAIWKLNAISIAAQILTVPLSIYHFHQFPNYFLLTNFIAVPLSSAILLGEILLCAVSLAPFSARMVGKLLAWLIRVMDSYIQKIEALPFSVWDSLQISFMQMVFLLVFITGTSYWLLERSGTGLKAGLIALLAFVAFRSWSFIQSDQQQKIIVYNIPQHRAIDLVDHRKFFFAGDSELLKDDFAKNFHLKPSRTLYRAEPVQELNELFIFENYINYHGRHILLLDTAASYAHSANRPIIDLLVISGNPRIFLPKLSESLDIRLVVFDGSASARKLRYWKKDCDSLGIPYHVANEKGAFVMRLR